MDEELRRLLVAILTLQGVDATSEQGQIAIEWVAEEMSQPVRAVNDLAAALRMASEVYTHFHDSFNSVYEAQDGAGTAFVRRALRRRCGSAHSSKVEELLER